MDGLTALLAEVRFLSLATVCADGTPWNSPLYYHHDSAGRIYWVSWIENVHSQNVIRTERAFATIFRSVGKGDEDPVGLYLDLDVDMLEDESDLGVALSTYKSEFGPFSKDEVLAPNPRRFFRGSPRAAWFNSDGEQDGQFVDQRVELEVDDYIRLADRALGGREDFSKY